MTKFKVLCRMEHATENFHFSTRTVTPSSQSQLPDCSATLHSLDELTLSPRSLKYLEVIFKVTFSLALPSWLLKLPNSSNTKNVGGGPKAENFKQRNARHMLRKSCGTSQNPIDSSPFMKFKNVLENYS